MLYEKVLRVREGIIQFIELAQVLDGATPFKTGNVSHTYRAMVRTSDGIDRTAIVKDIPAKELANEVLAAAVGIAVSLPIPPACIAFATADRLPAKKGPELGNGRLLFASVDVQQPPVAMLLAGSSADYVLQRLAEWSGVGRLYGFDSLVANIDRHAGNLLFSGNREVWLIDHGYCFTGPAWQQTDLTRPDEPVRNRLREWLTPVLDIAKRSSAAGSADEVARSLSGMDIAGLAQANFVADLLDKGEFSAVVDYLAKRRPHVSQLAAVALEMLA